MDLENIPGYARPLGDTICTRGAVGSEAGARPWVGTRRQAAEKPPLLREDPVGTGRGHRQPPGFDDRPAAEAPQEVP
jgi:hypothetical protein